MKKFEVWEVVDSFDAVDCETARERLKESFPVGRALRLVEVSK